MFKKYFNFRPADKLFPLRNFAFQTAPDAAAKTPSADLAKSEIPAGKTEIIDKKTDAPQGAPEATAKQIDDAHSTITTAGKKTTDNALGNLQRLNFTV